MYKHHRCGNHNRKSEWKQRKTHALSNFFFHNCYIVSVSVTMTGSRHLLLRVVTSTTTWMRHFSLLTEFNISSLPIDKVAMQLLWGWVAFQLTDPDSEDHPSITGIHQIMISEAFNTVPGPLPVAVQMNWMKLPWWSLLPWCPLSSWTRIFSESANLFLSWRGPGP